MLHVVLHDMSINLDGAHHSNDSLCTFPSKIAQNSC